MKKYILFFCAATLFGTSIAQAAILPASSSAEPASTEATIETAALRFKQLSKQERKEKSMAVNHAVQQYRDQLKDGESIDSNKLLAIIFAILIPPIGVVIFENKVTTKFWISLLLTLIFFLPGMIYSLLVVTGNA